MTVAHALTGTMAKRHDPDTDTLIAHSLSSEGADASEDGTGRGTPIVVGTLQASGAGSNRPAGMASELDFVVTSPVAATVRSHNRNNSDPTTEARALILAPIVTAPLTQNAHADNKSQESKIVLAPSVVSNGDAHSGFRDEKGLVIPLQEIGKRTGKSTDDPRAGIGIGESGAPMYSLQAGAQHGVMAYDPVNITSKANRSRVEPGLPSPTLHAGGMSAVVTAPRRLTPRECERLQGFPDDQTLIPGASDSPRYRALGNAVAVPCVRWIMRRIHQAIPEIETVGELFAGIGGFGLAAELEGLRVTWASEIEPFARRVYATRFPHVELVGDCRQVRP